MPKDCIEDDIFRYLNSYLSIFLHKKIDFPFRMYDVKSMWIDDCLLNSLRSWEKSCRKKWWVVYESVSIRKYFFYTETSSLHSLSVCLAIWPLTKEGYIHRASHAPTRCLDFCSLVQGNTPINCRKQGVMRIFSNPDPTENSKQNIFLCCFF